MSIKISKSAFKQLIQEDLEALRTHMPKSLERDHIEQVLDYSIAHLYPDIAEARKPLGIQEARNLVNQMLAEEISFGRFVELINEGGK